MALIGMKHEEDSGWQTLNSTYGASYRKLNGVVYLKVIYNGNIPQDTNLGTLPQGYAPVSNLRFPNYTSANGANFIAVNYNGSVTKGGSGTDWINCACSYPAT